MVLRLDLTHVDVTCVGSHQGLALARALDAWAPRLDAAALGELLGKVYTYGLMGREGFEDVRRELEDAGVEA
ncbi:MAG: hypothetical protein U5K81_07695 [Trueperaceae bacterium]|nr:hypothetical protein [Trueperaceae bacterium]